MERKKKNVIIAVLCCLIIVMSVGYALLSQQLQINGVGTISSKWNVKITSVTENSKKGYIKDVTMDHDDTNAIVSATFQAPGDWIEFKVRVENQGTIDAILEKITINKNDNGEKEYINVSLKEIDEGEILGFGDYKEFIIRMEIDEAETSLPNQVEDYKIIAKIDLGYIQVSSMSLRPIQPDENVCYTVNGKGVLTKYNYDCGTEVSVPAEVNGVALKEISTDAFSNYNVVMFAGSGEDYGYPYDQYYITFGLTDEEIEGIKTNMFPQLCKSSTTGEVVQSCVDDMIAGTIKREDLTDEEYAGFEAAFGKEYAYIDTSTYTPGPVTHYVTTLDLSGATNLEAIRYGAFANANGNGPLTSINFGNIQSLTTIEDYAFVGNKLTNAEVSPLPASLTTLSTTAFVSNSGLTQLTLTSASDISGWTNGSNVNGITVTYQR